MAEGLEPNFLTPEEVSSVFSIPEIELMDMMAKGIVQFWFKREDGKLVSTFSIIRAQLEEAGFFYVTDDFFDDDGAAEI
jgi:hypothetical protein